MRRRRLGGITAPTPIDVRGHIVSPDAVESVVTGARGVLIEFFVFVPARFEQRAGREAHDRLVDTGLWGEPFAVATDDGLLWVSLENVTPYFQGANAEEHPLLEPLPEGLAYLREIEGAAPHLAVGALYFRELVLRNGDGVRVRGTAGPAEGCGAYRVSASIPFVLRGDLEAATVSFDVPEFA